MKVILVDPDIVAPGYAETSVIVDPEIDIVAGMQEPLSLVVGETVAVFFDDQTYKTTGLVVDALDDESGTLYIVDIDYDGCVLIPDDE